MFRLLIALASLGCLLINAQSTIPQVQLCSQGDCPYVSRIGMGTLHLGDKIGGTSNPDVINKWIKTALSVGINLFDLSDVYPVKGGDNGDSAKLFGQALALTPSLREQIVIVAKMDIIFPNTIDTSRQHLLDTVDWFLTVLGTTYLDIMLLHYPNSYMNATEVGQVFVDLKNANKVRHFGTSNHYPSHFDVLQTKLDEQFASANIHLVTNEVELSVWNPSYMNYNSNIVDHAYQHGYRNLGWGGLAGDPLGGLNRLFVKKGTRQERILNALQTVGTTIGESDLTRVALAWTLAHPSGIVPLIGTTNITRVTNLANNIMALSASIDTASWWVIGNAGGLCPLADSQCNYSEYQN